MKRTNRATISITGTGPEAAGLVQGIVASLAERHAYALNGVSMSSSGSSATVNIQRVYDDGEQIGGETAAMTATDKPEGIAAVEKGPEKPADTAADKPSEEEACDCPACQFRAVLASAIFGNDAKAEDAAGIRLVRIPIRAS